MAILSPLEFTRAVRALTDHYGLERTRDRLASLGAFKQRRGLNSAEALADRLFRLSGGLRLQTRPTIAFSALWGEMLRAKLGEEGERNLESIAERVNACLGPKEEVVEGKEADLDAALREYRGALAAQTSADIAASDMLLKAVPAVADRLRAGGTLGEAAGNADAAVASHDPPPASGQEGGPASDAQD